MLRTHLNRMRKNKRINETKDLYSTYKRCLNTNNSINDFNLLYESMIKYLKNPYELNVINLLIAGFTFKEIGCALNTSSNTIHTRHRLVRQRLRKELA